MEQRAPHFEKLLHSHSIASLRQHTGAIYGIWSDFRLAYLNPGWFRFALENGGEPQITFKWKLGVSILDAVSFPLRAFYEHSYRHCLRSQQIWNHEYECSSDSVYRWLHQIVYPLGQAEGLLIVNSVKIERPHDPQERPVQPAEDVIYRDQYGLAHQCAHCRRVRNLLERERWDWIPEWVKQVPQATTHTLCFACYGHYYPLVANG